MFKESDVRAMGRAAAGVRGIRLADKDELVGTDTITSGGKDQFFLNMGSKGYGKKTSVKIIASKTEAVRESKLSK